MEGDNIDFEALQKIMDKPIRTELTRRDHFAIAALAAMLQAPRYVNANDWYAETAYKFADAMEKARGVGPA